MKVAVYGGGAVGLGVASCLLQSGVEVDIVARSETLFALEQEGLERIGIFGKVWFGAEKFGRLTELKKTDYDFILVCVKSFDTSIVAEEIVRAFRTASRDIRIVHCQNGWGNEEIFAEKFPRENIFSSRVITGFRRSLPNSVDITVHAEPIHLGSLFTENIGGLNPLAKAINDGGIPCETVFDIEKDLITKLLYNCALNPLGAIFGVPYGVLGESERTRSLMFRLVEEVFRSLQDRKTHWATSEEYMQIFYQKLLPPTSRHESSMLQDIRAGRKTEIEAINGAVVRLGLRKGIATPCNAMICDMIKFLEECPALTPLSGR